MGTARGGAWAPPLASFPAKPSSGVDCWPKILGKWEFGAALVRIPGFVALLSLSPHPPPSPSTFQHFPPALIPLIPRDGTPSAPNPIPELWKRWGPPVPSRSLLSGGQGTPKPPKAPKSQLSSSKSHSEPLISLGKTGISANQAPARWNCPDFADRVLRVRPARGQRRSWERRTFSRSLSLPPGAVLGLPGLGITRELSGEGFRGAAGG